MNLKNVTPVLKGNSFDTSKAYASSEATTGTAYAWKAFDNVANSAWTSLVMAKSAWIELLFAKETTVDYIEVISTHNIQLPKKILVYGSNDRKTYDLIHTISDITVDQYPLGFKIPRKTYKCFRLSFPESLNTSTSNYAYYFTINQINFYEDLDYIGVSENIKNLVLNTINNNKLMQNVLTAKIE